MALLYGLFYICCPHITCLVIKRSTCTINFFDICIERQEGQLQTRNCPVDREELEDRKVNPCIIMREGDAQWKRKIN